MLILAAFTYWGWQNRLIMQQVFAELGTIRLMSFCLLLTLSVILSALSLQYLCAAWAILLPALHKKSGQKSDSAVNKDFLASFWRLFKTKKSLFGRKKHRQGTLFVQSRATRLCTDGLHGQAART